ncbi:MAG: hypothetical protein IPJ77_09290 [Planctomycetes bacterium]|nr:hypothetical protein [Planctomycetota bacterium]
MRTMLGRTALATCGALVLAGVLEALLLLAGFAHARAPEPFERAFAGGRVDGYRFLERDLRELWRTVPGARVPWSGDVLDAHGFRGAAPAPERASGVARIAVLGGSAAIGRGVGAEETFGHVAARELDARGIPCEVVEAGVPNATLVQARARWVRALHAWKPDVVLLAFSGFEEHAPALGASDVELARTGPPAEPGPLVRLARGSKLGAFGAWIASGCSSAPEAAGDAGADPAGDPAWPGARRVAIDDVRAELDELARLVRAEGAELVLVALPARPPAARAAPVLERYARAAESAVAELGIARVDGRALFAAAVAEGATYQDLFAGPAEPAQLGHARLGRAVAELLADRLARR